MMMDYGPYTSYIISAYGLSLIVLAGLTLISCWQRRNVKQQLEHYTDKDHAA